MKKILLVTILLGFAGITWSAENPTPTERFTQANQALEKGDLEKANELYDALVAQGFESAELYYNLGNLYYRKGERGKAVLWYERAERLAPRDADIQFNLKLARSHIKDDEGNALRKTFLYFTDNELSVVLVVLVWIFFGILGGRTIGWIKAEVWPTTALWFSGVMLLMVGAWFGVALAMGREPIGVVINPPGEVRNGPGPDYAVGFTIPEGSDVVLLNRRPDWTQVGVPNQGLKGWMPNSDLEAVKITPSS